MKSSLGINVVLSTILVLEALAIPFPPSSETQGNYPRNQWSSQQPNTRLYNVPAQDWTSKTFQQPHKPTLYPAQASIYSTSSAIGSALGYNVLSPQLTNTFNSAPADSYTSKQLTSLSQPGPGGYDPKLKLVDIRLPNSQGTKMIPLPLTSETTKYKVYTINPNASNFSLNAFPIDILQPLKKAETELERVKPLLDDLIHRAGQSPSIAPSDTTNQAYNNLQSFRNPGGSFAQGSSNSYATAASSSSGTSGTQSSIYAATPQNYLNQGKPLAQQSNSYSNAQSDTSSTINNFGNQGGLSLSSNHNNNIIYGNQGTSPIQEVSSTNDFRPTESTTNVITNGAYNDRNYLPVNYNKRGNEYDPSYYNYGPINGNQGATQTQQVISSSTIQATSNVDQIIGNQNAISTLQGDSGNQNVPNTGFPVNNYNNDNSLRYRGVTQLVNGSSTSQSVTPKVEKTIGNQNGISTQGDYGFPNGPNTGLPVNNYNIYNNFGNQGGLLNQLKSSTDAVATSYGSTSTTENGGGIHNPSNGNFNLTNGNQGATSAQKVGSSSNSQATFMNTNGAKNANGAIFSGNDWLVNYYKSLYNSGNQGGLLTQPQSGPNSVANAFNGVNQNQGAIPNSNYNSGNLYNFANQGHSFSQQLNTNTAATASNNSPPNNLNNPLQSLSNSVLKLPAITSSQNGLTSLPSNYPTSENPTDKFHVQGDPYKYSGRPAPHYIINNEPHKFKPYTDSPNIPSQDQYVASSYTPLPMNNSETNDISNNGDRQTNVNDSKPSNRFISYPYNNDGIAPAQQSNIPNDSPSYPLNNILQSSSNSESKSPETTSSQNEPTSLPTTYPYNNDGIASAKEGNIPNNSPPYTLNNPLQSPSNSVWQSSAPASQNGPASLLSTKENSKNKFQLHGGRNKHSPRHESFSFNYYPDSFNPLSQYQLSTAPIDKISSNIDNSGTNDVPNSSDGSSDTLPLADKDPKDYDYSIYSNTNQLRPYADSFNFTSQDQYATPNYNTVLSTDNSETNDSSNGDRQTYDNDSKPSNSFNSYPYNNDGIASAKEGNIPNTSPPYTLNNPLQSPSNSMWQSSAPASQNGPASLLSTKENSNNRFQLHGGRNKHSPRHESFSFNYYPDSFNPLSQYQLSTAPIDKISSNIDNSGTNDVPNSSDGSSDTLPLADKDPKDYDYSIYSNTNQLRPYADSFNFTSQDQYATPTYTVLSTDNSETNDSSNGDRQTSDNDSKPSKSFNSYPYNNDGIAPAQEGKVPNDSPPFPLNNVLQSSSNSESESPEATSSQNEPTSLPTTYPKTENPINKFQLHGGLNKYSHRPHSIINNESQKLKPYTDSPNIPSQDQYVAPNYTPQPINKNETDDRSNNDDGQIEVNDSKTPGSQFSISHPYNDDGVASAKEGHFQNNSPQYKNVDDSDYFYYDYYYDDNITNNSDNNTSNQSQIDGGNNKRAPSQPSNVSSMTSTTLSPKTIKQTPIKNQISSTTDIATKVKDVTNILKPQGGDYYESDYATVDDLSSTVSKLTASTTSTSTSTFTNSDLTSEQDDIEDSEDSKPSRGLRVLLKILAHLEKLFANENKCNTCFA